MLEMVSLRLAQDPVATLVIPVCEDQSLHRHKLLTSLVEAAMALPEFSGKDGELVTFYPPLAVKAERIILMGLGKLAQLTAERLRRFAGRAVKQAMQKNLSQLVLTAPSTLHGHLGTELMLQALLEGACLGNHRFDQYKQDSEQRPLKLVSLQVAPAVARRFHHLPQQVATVCQGTVMAREWVSMPPNLKRPPQLIQAMVARAEQAGLRCKVLDEKQLKKLKCGALLAVSAGSQSKPGLVIMEYAPKGARSTVALVGKGVTFDSGGMNLKPTNSLEGMKVDMAGAAAVAATMITAPSLGLKQRLVAALPVVENMLSGSATRPGDVVTSHSGKNIEIGNTDAEGRLILVDAMAYLINTYHPEVIIDLATLTGACVVALGEQIAGVFTPDTTLGEALVTAGDKINERCWRMPLPEDYKELLKSDIADIRNIGSTRWGGAIAAALFLKEFVGETRWAHVDIAGPAAIKKGTDYCEPGGTGFGVRLLCELLARHI